MSQPPPPLSLEMQAADGRLVGTPKILESPRVVALSTNPTSPPTTIPTPSVFVDDRGEIHNVRVGDVHRIDPASSSPAPLVSPHLKQTRYNILYTKAGMMRSGDLHGVPQHDFVFEGRVRVWLLQRDGSTSSQSYGPRSYVCVPPYTPHLFEFLHDTVMAEWWDSGEFGAWFYEPYRDVVMEQRSSAAPKKRQGGRLVRYAVQPPTQPFALFSWRFLAGLAAGLSIGAWWGGGRR